METQTYTLLTNIKGSISWIVNRKPSFYESDANYVAVFWEVTPNQDTLYDMFNSKDDIDYYYGLVKSTFENTYPYLYLDVKYSYGPVEINNKMYSRIIYYYSEKNYQYTNSFFAC
jgi:hypothetical protein